MSAQDDIQRINDLLDELGKKVASDGAYRDEILEADAEDLADAGLNAAVLADVLVSVGADGDDVEGFNKGFEMMGNQVIIQNKKTTVARCLTGSGKRGRSCGGNTVVISGRTIETGTMG